MRYRKLGRTGVDVSVICLGTMTWGEQNSEAEAFEQMDYALDKGVNFFDAAELYPIPPKRSTAGRTETIIGNWFAARKNRDKVILATKVCGRTDMDWFREGKPACLERDQIFYAVEGSLKRLQTDYIDLYQLHWPDRPLELFKGLEYKHMPSDSVPIGETLAALGELVEQGKIRHVGLSNETAWGTMNFLQEAEANGLPRVASIQNAYSLVNRSFEVDLSEIAHREDVGLLAYSPLGQGYLSGKYEGGVVPKGSRKEMFGRMGRYETGNGSKAITAYCELAKKHGFDPAQVALQFVTSRPFVTSTIIGATKMEQLRTDIGSLDVDLTRELILDIEDIHQTYTNPCP